MYSCGPTVYGPPHIGNLRSRLFSDLLKRFLLSEGLEVTHVINITDVGHLVSDADEGEDKIEAAARRTGKSAEEIAAHYTQVWRDDGAAVNCLPPEHNPKATDHIPEQIELARRLEAGGYLYRIADGLYFDTSRFPRYAELARLDLAGQAEGARIGVTRGQAQSGRLRGLEVRRAGRPATAGVGLALGPRLSRLAPRVLGDGRPLPRPAFRHPHRRHRSRSRPPHERGRPERVRLRRASLGRVLDAQRVPRHGLARRCRSRRATCGPSRDLVAQGIDPLAFRYFFLQAHYRQQQSFSDEAIQSAATGYRRLQGVAGSSGSRRTRSRRRRSRRATRRRPSPSASASARPWRDDLNAPKAMAVVWEVARTDTLSAAARRELLRAFDRVLGLASARRADGRRRRVGAGSADRRACSRSARRRKQARNFAEADRIRDALKAEGIEIVDSPTGPRWRRGKPK